MEDTEWCSPVSSETLPLAGGTAKILADPAFLISRVAIRVNEPSLGCAAFRNKAIPRSPRLTTQGPLEKTGFHLGGGETTVIPPRTQE